MDGVSQVSLAHLEGQRAARRAARSAGEGVKHLYAYPDSDFVCVCWGITGLWGQSLCPSGESGDIHLTCGIQRHQHTPEISL